jgi:hypothetical protein
LSCDTVINAERIRYLLIAQDDNVR